MLQGNEKLGDDWLTKHLEANFVLRLKLSFPRRSGNKLSALLLPFTFCMTDDVQKAVKFFEWGFQGRFCCIYIYGCFPWIFF